MKNYRVVTAEWFADLREHIIKEFEALEILYANKNNLANAGSFTRTAWDRSGGGGGEMAVMRGNVFEKVGVNISTVHGNLAPELRNNLPGDKDNDHFFATGVSLVAHMHSPFVPAVHFNTRYIETTKHWFGGGADLTPIFPEIKETDKFHYALKEACDRYDHSYYPRFKKECDEYFYLHHRNEPRGQGGIFYDYLNTGNFEQDFSFTQDVGKSFAGVYPEIVEAKLDVPWNEEDRKYQLHRRGRYVEFNLLYDRGTKFGLLTGGNIEAIMMSMPPNVSW